MVCADSHACPATSSMVQLYRPIHEQCHVATGALQHSNSSKEASSIPTSPTAITTLPQQQPKPQQQEQPPQQQYHSLGMQTNKQPAPTGPKQGRIRSAPSQYVGQFSDVSSDELPALQDHPAIANQPTHAIPTPAAAAVVAGRASRMHVPPSSSMLVAADATTSRPSEASGTLSFSTPAAAASRHQHPLGRAGVFYQPVANLYKRLQMLLVVNFRRLCSPCASAGSDVITCTALMSSSSVWW